MTRAANPPPHRYSSVGLDRAAHRRREPEWLQHQLGLPETRLLPMHGLQVLADMADDPQLAWLSPTQLSGLDELEPLFLGIRDDRAHFALEIDGLDIDHLDYVEVRAIGSLLTAAEAGLAAYARAIVHWRTRHRFCGACGQATQPIDGGHARRCGGCGLDSFPRTDPAVIVLVSDGERCVLGRSWRIPARIYSTLAGFVEPGESIEQTVAREVHEEVGLEVESVRYRSSQPWPFPQSLMLGFQAHARFAPLRIDAEEMEDARWITREELRDPERRPVQLPNADSIARFLIEEWLLEEV